MGEYISFSQGLLVAVVSIVAVFVVLILIAFLISGLKAFSGEDKKKVESKPEAKKESVNTPLVTIQEDPNQITEELVAVIAAAIAANLGMNIPDINIKSIRRVPQMTSTWSNAGTMKGIMGRL